MLTIMNFVKKIRVFILAASIMAPIFFTACEVDEVSPEATMPPKDEIKIPPYGK